MTDLPRDHYPAFKADGIFAHFDFRLIAKRQMLAGGDVAASKKCPYCEGRWHFTLAGSRNHLHGRCDGTCGRAFLE
jgi:hypothetical protein